MSSAYPKRPRRARMEPCLKMGSIKSINRMGEIASKAPCTSSVSMEDFKPCDQASSTSWTSAAARSVAERSGRAPNCCGWRTLCLIAIHANRRPMRRSRPFPKTDRREINLYVRGELRSLFPGFEMATSEASRKGVGCQPWARQFRYNDAIAGPRMGHAFLRMRVDTPSFPGVLFLGLAIALYISFSEVSGKGRRGC
ncbi:uncharacterized protein ASPGLDRAFT_377816 [Aspergillus glaucus CBS 516.65]|uniref:Uncharacterized protein n=1 Tax=Aspergillus glaucus CBS 516.65 TaxID=1160497 RepID=A0A1L9VJG0_ASPGL|nr:hypothetical protein ASPGLDRAFT_377816 [Aspergillus glaucus CBS 516.65]OJJ84061.1 hypothetical protein ASPGLDRAFT_377816 [Aspergillus glaucus CBS 516.65]